MTKLRHVPSLTEAAKRLLQNIEHVNRKIPGTQDIRRLMRFDLQGYRVRYGVRIFVTFSPGEPNNVLVLRLSSTRRKGPVFADGRDVVCLQLVDVLATYRACAWTCLSEISRSTYPVTTTEESRLREIPSRPWTASVSWCLPLFNSSLE